MKQDLKKTPIFWIARHAILVWIGIFLNALMIAPLLFCPEWLLALFNVPPLEQAIWARFAAILLTIISIFYIPATIDFYRYRVFAWLAVFPSRTFGAAFFAAAVFLFDQAPGFLIGTLLDGSVGLATLYCLIKIQAAELAQGNDGAGS